MLDEKLKSFSMKDLQVALNKYIGENLKLNEVYYTHSVYDRQLRDIHYIIRKNMEKGLIELLCEHKVNVDSFEKIFRLGNFTITLNVDYDKLHIFEDIGVYSYDTKRRKNQSWERDDFKLMSIPCFNFKEDSLMNLSVYDYLIYKLKEDKQSRIAYKNGQIESYLVKIEEEKREIKEIEKIKI